MAKSRKSTTKKKRPKNKLHARRRSRKRKLMAKNKR